MPFILKILHHEGISLAALLNSFISRVTINSKVWHGWLLHRRDEYSFGFDSFRWAFILTCFPEVTLDSLFSEAMREERVDLLVLLAS